MEKRSSERINADVEIRFSYGYLFYTGTLSNLSERGMFIRTRNCLPDDSVLLIMFQDKSELLKILARVKRKTKSNSSYDGMGVEILNPPRRYLAFVNSLKSVYST